MPGSRRGRGKPSACATQTLHCRTAFCAPEAFPLLSQELSYDAATAHFARTALPLPDFFKCSKLQESATERRGRVEVIKNRFSHRVHLCERPKGNRPAGRARARKLSWLRPNYSIPSHPLLPSLLPGLPPSLRLLVVNDG